MIASEESVMTITSHAAGAVLVQRMPDGQVLTDRMKYTMLVGRGGWSFRHFMETGEAGESVRQTLATGLYHEVAKDASNFEYRLLQDEPVRVEFGPDQRNPGGTHMKAIFMVEVIAGELRDFELRDGNELLGPVEWVDIGSLIAITEGKTPPVHVNASKAALSALAGDPKIFHRYQKIIFGWNPPELSQTELEAIGRYSNKW